MTQEFSHIQPTEVIENSLPKINKNFDSLRSGFSGNAFPTDPLTGQKAYIDNKWFTYNGTKWEPDDLAVESLSGEVDSLGQQLSSVGETTSQHSQSILTNTLQLQQLQDAIADAVADLEIAKADAAAAKEQAAKAIESPIGTEVVGEWKQAPPGCLAYFGTRHSKAAFPDLWKHAQDQGLVKPKAEYDAAKTTYGAVGFYCEDTDPAYFWIPLQKYASTPIIEAITGCQLGDIGLDAAPEIKGEIGKASSSGVAGEDTLLHPFTSKSDGHPATGAFQKTLYDKYDVNSGNSTGATGSTQSFNFDFKASRCSLVYGRDDKIQIRRVHKLYCVRAYHVVTPVAAADMAALTGEIQKNGVDIAALRHEKEHAHAVISDTRLGTAQTGNTTADQWKTRPLNTEDYNGIEGLTVDFATGTIMLPVGTYRIDAVVGAYRGDRNLHRIYNAATGTSPILANSYSNTSHGVEANTLLSGVITVTKEGGEGIRIQTRTDVVASSHCFGVNNNVSTWYGCYTKVMIEKIK